MTARAQFTQASLKRAILAVQQAGLRVKGISADGTVLVYDRNEPGQSLEPDATLAPETSKWLEVEA